MPHRTSSLMRRSIALLRGLLRSAAIITPAVAPVLISMQPMIARADEKSDKDREREKWENLIQFYGEENTGRFSLRVLDKETKETGSFVFLSFWKYDPTKNEWVKMKDGPKQSRILLPKDKPADAPRDSQVLVELPITIQDVGVFFAKWTVNGVEGSTFTRIGPHAPRKEQKVPDRKPGEIITDVPLDHNKAELRAIPDPVRALKDR